MLSFVEGDGRLRLVVPPPKLTMREKRFLAREGIPQRWVADASQCQTSGDRKFWMDTTSTCLAVGFHRCEQGHRLANTRGKCVECDPSLLSRTRRWTAEGYVYLAESRWAKLIKLGSCGDFEERERTLNARTYAGYDDWCVRLCHYTVAAEMFEYEMSTHLERFTEPTLFLEYRRQKTAMEVYRCTFRTAKRHFERVLNEVGPRYNEIYLQCLNDEANC